MEALEPWRRLACTPRGAWTRDAEPVLVGDRPSDADRVLTPCLVPLGGARVRLYYTGDGPARAHRGARGCIQSALSVDGGHTFVKEPGIRLDVSSPDGETRVLCPEVVALHGGGYRMYFEARSAHGTACIASATSPDGLVFVREPGIRYEVRGRWIGTPKLARCERDAWRLYFHEHSPPDRRGAIDAFFIASALSRDGLAFEREDGIRIGREAPSCDAYAVDCPELWSLPSGACMMIFAAWDSPRTGALHSAFSDDGLVWTRAGALMPPYGEPCFESEPSLLVLPDGRLRVFFERGHIGGATEIASATLAGPYLTSA